MISWREVGGTQFAELTRVILIRLGDQIRCHKC